MKQRFNKRWMFPGDLREEEKCQETHPTALQTAQFNNIPH